VTVAVGTREGEAVAVATDGVAVGGAITLAGVAVGRGGVTVGVPVGEAIALGGSVVGDGGTVVAVIVGTRVAVGPGATAGGVWCS
jgi:hypothetical protein